MHLTRNATDGVAQHRHLSETVSEASTPDRSRAYSAERIFSFFSSLSRVPRPELLGIRNALIPIVYWVLSKMELLTECFLRHDEFTSDYYSTQLTLTISQENETHSIVQLCSALGGGLQK